jgi:hypothetical protein
MDFAQDEPVPGRDALLQRLAPHLLDRRLGCEFFCAAFVQELLKRLGGAVHERRMAQLTKLQAGSILVLATGANHG